MKKHITSGVRVKHRFCLYNTIETEKWLSTMAKNGLLLQRIDGHNYYFKEGEPSQFMYFLMDPEVGTNSDSWIFYEFLQKYGQRIPCRNSIFSGPSRALFVSQDIVVKALPLIEYYYQYRNYRLANRLLRNTVASFAFTILGVVIGIVGTTTALLFILPYLAVSVFLSVHFGISFYRFLKICRKYGLSRPIEKPNRPGY